MDGNLTVILPVMDLLNSVILPCVIMTITTILLINSIYKMRFLQGYYSMRMSNINTNWANKQCLLAFKSITLNSVYIIITLPFPIVLLLGDLISDSLIYLKFYLFCTSFSIKFYILLMMNNSFRMEFFSVFRSIFCKSNININHAVDSAKI